MGAVDDVAPGRMPDDQNPSTTKIRPAIPAKILPLRVTLETYSTLTSKPPPRMATANKIAPNMNDIACSVIALLIAHNGADTAR